jgi:hypothetical protein
MTVVTTMKTKVHFAVRKKGRWTVTLSSRGQLRTLTVRTLDEVKHHV